jgi:hypothetical protein
MEPEFVGAAAQRAEAQRLLDAAHLRECEAQRMVNWPRRNCTSRAPGDLGPIPWDEMRTPQPEQPPDLLNILGHGHA